MRDVQVAVVGAGPAGLAAAIGAARAGAATVLLDEGPEPGGQLRYRVADLDPGGEVGSRVALAALRDRLVADALAAGVEVRRGALVWGLFGGNVLGVVAGAASFALRAERVVLATGSTDRPCPSPGATLPGVFSARAVQVLLHVHRVRPGRRFVVVGDGAEAVEVAADIGFAEGEVVARVGEGEAGELTVEGDGGVEAVTIRGRRVGADVVVVAVGRQPDAGLALMAGCDATYEAGLGGWVPTRDGELRTSVPGVFACGDGAGVGDVATAVAEGALAGAAVAASLRLASADDVRAAQAGVERAAPQRWTTVRPAAAIG